MKTFAATAILTALAAVTAAQSAPPLAPNLATLVERERAFARMSVEKGRRDAFLAFFADDAFFMAPGPINAKQTIRRWPQAASFQLDWEPRFGDIARAGDIGYTTGPFVRTSLAEHGRVVGTGWYFTVWKKQPDGNLKVAFDTGIVSPAAGALRPATFTPAISDAALPTTAPAGSVLDADRALSGALASSDALSALLAITTEDARLYRDNAGPVVGAAAIRAYFTPHSSGLHCQPTGNEVSRSDDLAYTYGTYTAEHTSARSGYYFRMWKRRAGQWKLAFDVLISSE